LQTVRPRLQEGQRLLFRHVLQQGLLRERTGLHEWSMRLPGRLIALRRALCNGLSRRADTESFDLCLLGDGGDLSSRRLPHGHHSVWHGLLPRWPDLPERPVRYLHADLRIRHDAVRRRLLPARPDV
jgi:hypothetical protein